jgi:hypothetical protein
MYIPEPCGWVHICCLHFQCYITRNLARVTLSLRVTAHVTVDCTAPYVRHSSIVLATAGIAKCSLVLQCPTVAQLPVIRHLKGHRARRFCCDSLGSFDHSFAPHCHRHCISLGHAKLPDLCTHRQGRLATSSWSGAHGPTSPWGAHFRSSSILMAAQPHAYVPLRDG